MICQNLFGDDITRDQSSDNAGARHRTALLGLLSAILTETAAFTERIQADERSEGIVRPLPAKVSRQQPDKTIEITAQRRMHRHLHSEVFQYQNALRTSNPLRGLAKTSLRHAADSSVLGDRNRHKDRFDRLQTYGVFGQPFARDQLLLNQDRR